MGARLKGVRMDECEVVDGFVCPIDPAEAALCEGCQ